LIIYDRAHELAQEIQKSAEYQELVQVSHKINENSENQKVLAQFHAKQLEIQALQMMGQEIPPEKKTEYQQMTELLGSYPVVRDYLQAEFKLLRMMADVQKILADAVDILKPAQI